MVAIGVGRPIWLEGRLVVVKFPLDAESRVVSSWLLGGKGGLLNAIRSVANCFAASSFVACCFGDTRIGWLRTSQEQRE